MRSAALALSALLFVACKAPPPSSDHSSAASAPTAPSGATPSAPSSARVASSSPSRVLALSKPGGSANIDREIEAYQKGLAGDAPLADRWVLLGRAWVKKARDTSDPGFYLNANACADVALELAPDNRAALNLRGLVLLNQHKFDDARDLAQQALRRSPEDLMALGNLSDAYLETGHYDEATKAAQHMMDLKPNLPSYIRASYLEWLRGDTKAAVESARHAIDAGRDPREPEPRCWALVQAAILFWHQGDVAGADAGFQTALKECTDYPPALAGRAQVALAKGEAAHAAELAQLSLKESPLLLTAWLLGDARSAAGDEKGAAEAYAQVVKIGKASDARSLALFWATKNQEHDEALRLAQLETKIRDDIYTEDTLAWALYRAGKFAEARAAADKATSLGTRDARLLYHAGAIRIAAGDKAAGKKLVEDALALNPNFDPTGAAEAKKLVASL